VARRLSLIFAICLALAACGSSGSSTSSTPSSASATAGGSGSTNAAKLVGARVAAAKCMRGQGINIPDPGPTRASVLRMLSVLASFPAVKVKAAEQACMGEIRQAFPNATSLTPAERTQRIEEAQAFASCMRSHGIDVPDPTASPIGFYRALSSLAASSPAAKAQAVTCRAVALKDVGGG